MKTLIVLVGLILGALLVPLFSLRANAATSISVAEIHGNDVQSGAAIKPSLQNRKGLVAIFLSAVCPCSGSHVQELAALSKEHPDYVFVGIHSNTDEQKEPTQKYFKDVNLPFPVIQDNGAKIAESLHAYKTPHAYLIKPDGQIVYQGGVSSSHDFASAKEKYLRAALDHLEKNQPVEKSEGRTLGCVIARGEKNVW